jgi:predicted DNA-binding transcriptional regulator AlpA
MNLVDTSWLAEQLGCSTNAIAQRRYRGELPPAFKIGRRIYWDEDELVAWVKSTVEPRRCATARA